MAVLGAFYPANDAGDLHLVPGMDGPQLIQRLWLDLPSGPVRADLRDKSAISVTFGTNLLGPQGLLAGLHGVGLDTDTGQLTMFKPDPVDGLRSFVVTATVVEAGVTRATVRLRVHVHSRAESMWAAPKILTIRSGAQDMRLTVLARFTD